jgi:hypothetical protein
MSTQLLSVELKVQRSQRHIYARYACTQAEEAARESASLTRDAQKVSEASTALREASRCLHAATQALQRQRDTRAHLDACQRAADAQASSVREHQAALDAAKLALVVAEGETEGAQPSGGNFVHQQRCCIFISVSSRC